MGYRLRRKPERILGLGDGQISQRKAGSESRCSEIY